ncbi:MAG: hypothetical protein ACXWD4_14860, partial [Bacteroidia bacterium]
LKTISTKFFPCLNGMLDFDKKLKISITHDDFIEFFELTPPNKRNGFHENWILEYEVKLKKTTPDFSGKQL